MAREILNLPLPPLTQLKDYTIIKKISNGGFSFVYVAVNNITNETVAIKEFMPNSMKIRVDGKEVNVTDIKDKNKFDIGLKNFFQEMSVVAHIKHNNIIDVLDYFEENGTAYIVMPYEYGYPLSHYIGLLIKEKKQILEEDLIKISLGILEAIKEMHDNNILHLDIKPSNIWLRQNKEILIIDFGTSLEKTQVRVNQFFHSPGFAAPEQYKKYNLPLKIGYWTDYYGIGATIYNIITQRVPEDSTKLLNDKRQLDIFQMENGFHHYKILEIVNQLCQLDVEARKKVNIEKVIQEVKNIVPFNYVEKTIDSIITDRDSYELII